DRADVTDQVLERPRWLCGLRYDPGLPHLRKLLPLVLGLDDDRVRGEPEQADDLRVLGGAENDHGVALVGELLGEPLRTQHQRASRVDALQALRLDLRACRRWYAV